MSAEGNGDELIDLDSSFNIQRGFDSVRDSLRRKTFSSESMENTQQQYNDDKLLSLLATIDDDDLDDEKDDDTKDTTVLIPFNSNDNNTVDNVDLDDEKDDDTKDTQVLNPFYNNGDNGKKPDYPSPRGEKDHHQQQQLQLQPPQRRVFRRQREGSTGSSSRYGSGGVLLNRQNRRQRRRHRRRKIKRQQRVDQRQKQPQQLVQHSPSKTTISNQTSSTNTFATDATVDPYHVLQIRRDATLLEIRQAYRRLALLHHPHRRCQRQQQEYGASFFATLAACYETLMEPESRQRCDALLNELEEQRQACAGADNSSNAGTGLLRTPSGAAGTLAVASSSCLPPQKSDNNVGGETTIMMIPPYSPSSPAVAMPALSRASSGTSGSSSSKALSLFQAENSKNNDGNGTGTVLAKSTVQALSLPTLRHTTEEVNSFSNCFWSKCCLMDCVHTEASEVEKHAATANGAATVVSTKDETVNATVSSASATITNMTNTITTATRNLATTIPRIPSSPLTELQLPSLQMGRTSSSSISSSSSSCSSTNNISSDDSVADRHYTSKETNRLFGGPLKLLYQSRRWKPFTNASEVFANAFGSKALPVVTLTNINSNENKDDYLYGNHNHRQTLPPPAEIFASTSNTSPTATIATRGQSQSASSPTKIDANTFAGTYWTKHCEQVSDTEKIYRTRRVLVRGNTSNDRVCVTRTERVTVDPSTGVQQSVVTVTSEDVYDNDGNDGAPTTTSDASASKSNSLASPSSTWLPQFEGLDSLMPSDSPCYTSKETWCC